MPRTRAPQRCHLSRCLGHADQQTVEVTCARCGGVRWVPDPWIPVTKDGRAAGRPVPLVLPYTCQRCRAVLAGKNAADPLGTPAQRAALDKARHVNPGGFRQRTQAPIPPGESHDPEEA